MGDINNEPATKSDIDQLSQRIDSLEHRIDTQVVNKDDLIRFATKDDLAALESRMDTKLDTLADMIAGLGTKMDDFQKERIHRDEFQDLENRMKRVEKHAGLTPT